MNMTSFWKLFLSHIFEGAWKHFKYFLLKWRVINVSHMNYNNFIHLLNSGKISIFCKLKIFFSFHHNCIMCTFYQNCYDNVLSICFSIVSSVYFYVLNNVWVCFQWISKTYFYFQILFMWNFFFFSNPENTMK